MTDHISTPPGHLPGSGHGGADQFGQGNPAGLPPYPPGGPHGYQGPDYNQHTYPIPPGYGPPPQGVPPVGAGILGKRRNPFAAGIGLPIITLGIYFFVWVYKTNKELSQYDYRIKVDPTMSVLAFLFGWLIIVPPFVAAWRLGTRLQQAQRAAGIPETNPGLAFVVWLVGGGPLFLQFEINRLWDRYPGAVEGQQVPLSR